MRDEPRARQGENPAAVTTRDSAGSASMSMAPWRIRKLSEFGLERSLIAERQDEDEPWATRNLAGHHARAHEDTQKIDFEDISGRRGSAAPTGT